VFQAFLMKPKTLTLCVPIWLVSKIRYSSL
jgi:hypothetical protein